MHVSFVHIRNFRKLKDCSIDIQNDTTIFVGANNSGKTSAIMAFKKFLTRDNHFLTRDFTIFLWDEIAKCIITDWEKEVGVSNEELIIDKWIDFLPTFDIWIDATEDEAYILKDLVASLEDGQNRFGLRLRLEPDITNLYSAYREAFFKAQRAKNSVEEQLRNEIHLFPSDFHDFIEKHENLSKYFHIHYYVLDPKLSFDVNGRYIVTEVPDNIIETNPLKDILRIDFIDAFREFSDSQGQNENVIDTLSKQFQDYHKTVFEDSEEEYKVEDMGLHHSLSIAHKAHNEKLSLDFKPLIQNLKEINYPGFQNPSITIDSIIKLADSIHETSILFDADGSSTIKLHENFNGLGYRNLLSICIRLFQFKEDRIHPKKKTDAEFIPPLHLVFIEEPEAHLHAQAQQVFIKKVFGMLNEQPQGLEKYKTQLLISTHSNHIVNEIDMDKIRYFKRKVDGNKRICDIINLTHVFGEHELEQKKFVTRYIRLTHCDIYFADAAILVEGPAEKILMKHFMSQENLRDLNRSYVSVIEINGSHAHSFRPLIEKLGLITLIITDIDAQEEIKKTIKKDGVETIKSTWESCIPEIGKHQRTNNDTLKLWIPGKNEIDDLIKLSEDSKISGEIRVAYQTPISIQIAGSYVVRNPYTFEDSFILSNLDLFKKFKPRKEGSLTTVCNLASKYTDCESFHKGLYNNLQNKYIKKADLAVNLLYHDDFDSLKCPAYILEGLKWVEKKLLDFSTTMPN